MSLDRRQFISLLGSGAALGSARLTAAASQPALPSWLEPYRHPAELIVRTALNDHFAWERLAELTDTFGHRLSGSASLEAAIRWVVREMTRDGLENVHTEPVKVPRWVRGAERLDVEAPYPRRVPMLGLGGSVGTPRDGIGAELMVVDSFAELERRRDEARGRIVLFNAPFTDYSSTVVYRTDGPARAASAGAVAALVRSIGPEGLRTPHTGATRVTPGLPQVPAAAIPVEDARRLRRMVERGQRVTMRLYMEAETLPDADSANVIAELRGRERPDEIVLVGAHLDSWDVGEGASDNGGGCVAVWEIARLLKQLQLRPRRTIRVVLFTNEENGLRGAYNYRDVHRAELPKHVMMLESDLGVAAPRGFGVNGGDGVQRQVRAIAALLAPIGATAVQPSGGGADIRPSAEVSGTPMLSPDVESDRYFVVHHTEADTVDRISPVEMARHVAALTVMTYVVADMPHRLGEEPQAGPTASQ
ncbi:MAG TPA: M20/M25/M40 family metallo-hydrolase [Vicinamibacterales bacterium]|nr:M20/M25/M40 family metallo-hydrolase [Vicinamibacterales bacterium]